MIALPGPLVSPQWLADHIDGVRIVDVRWSMDSGPKRAAYEAGHLPGARFADLDADLSARPGPSGRHPLPAPEQFAEARARLGLDGRQPVVAYDDQSGAVAARLWWMLDALGLPAAVLDGGIGAWGGELASGPGPSIQVDPPEPVPWPRDRFVAADDILASVADGVVMLDARSRERFLGTPNPIDPRPGHVPGSRSRPWTDNIGGDGRFLPIEDLRDQLSAMGVEPGVQVIASCGSGVTGCHDLLAARLIGIEQSRLYAGSWSEWSLDESRPVETGDSA